MSRTAKIWREWWADESRERLAGSGYDSAAKLWDSDLPEFEQPNRGRGGRSWVSRLDLGEGRRLFLKRQEAHLSRFPMRAFRRLPTFLREFEALRALGALGLPVARPVCFARAGDRALLLTEEIEALGPFDLVVAGLGGRRRIALIEACGRLVRRFHDTGYRHGSLYPKHILVRTLEPPAFGLIDLEKSRPVLWRQRARLRDLDQLARRAGPEFSRADRRRFLLAYAGDDALLLERLRRGLGRRA